MALAGDQHRARHGGQRHRPQGGRQGQQDPADRRHRLSARPPGALRPLWSRPRRRHGGRTRPLEQRRQCLRGHRGGGRGRLRLPRLRRRQYAQRGGEGPAAHHPARHRPHRAGGRRDLRDALFRDAVGPSRGRLRGRVLGRVRGLHARRRQELRGRREHRLHARRVRLVRGHPGQHQPADVRHGPRQRPAPSRLRPPARQAAHAGAERADRGRGRPAGDEADAGRRHLLHQLRRLPRLHPGQRVRHRPRRTPVALREPSPAVRFPGPAAGRGRRGRLSDHPAGAHRDPAGTGLARPRRRLPGRPHQGLPPPRARTQARRQGADGGHRLLARAADPPPPRRRPGPVPGAVRRTARAAAPALLGRAGEQVAVRDDEVGEPSRGDDGGVVEVVHTGAARRRGGEGGAGTVRP
ncbi:hypothetical protein SGPA1_20910 [Streptomyces misionensis JCM 4497]